MTSAKKSAKGTAKRPKGHGRAPAKPAVKRAPTPAPAPPVDYSALVRAAADEAATRARAELRAELDARAAATPAPPPAPAGPSPFGQRAAPKDEQLQVRYTRAEHDLYARLAQRGDLWDGEPVARYEAMRRLAWEGARARGLLTDGASTAPAPAAASGG